MLKLIRPVLSVIVASGVVTGGLHAADLLIKGAADPMVYVMTNDATHNEILAYARQSDGRLLFKERVATGGRGSGGTTDPLQAQGALTLSQDHRFLFAVNSGSGTVSSFLVAGGDPVLVDRAPVGGSEPVAVAERGGTVYVLDAGGNGALVGFRTGARGRLQLIDQPVVHLTATHSGASSISISPDGTALAVIEKVPNNIDIVPIHADGTLGTLVVNHSVTPGAFAGAFTPKGRFIVSENQPNGTNISSISSYAVNPDGTITAVSQSLPTLGDGNCWNVVTPNGRWVYAENSATSSIAGFSIAAHGKLTPLAGTLQSSERSGTTNLDIAVSTDGRYIYTLNSGDGSVSTYLIREDGTLQSLGDLEDLPKSAGYNGIAAL